MGFYGNATYYLPNGTAKYIENNVVTTETINEGAVTTKKIALGTITGGINGNIAPNTIDSSNIVLDSISNDCLSEDYMFIEPYSIISSKTHFTEYLTSLAEKDTIICGHIELSNDITDNNGIILAAGNWMILKLSGTKSTFTRWLMIKASAIEEFIIERKTDNTWSILQENSLLIHDYVAYNIQSLANWRGFLSSKFYKNKNFIKNINFNIQSDERQNFQLYIDETTQLNDGKIIEGSYIGFWFDNDAFYLTDKKGNLINYTNNKFIIVNVPQIDLIPDNSIPLNKLEKACLNIEELGVITSINTLSEKLREIGKVISPSTICSFTSQNIEQLENDNVYYATLLIKDSSHSYWQISSSILGDFNNSFNIEAYSQFPELVENLIIEENSIQAKHIEDGAIAPNKLDRQYEVVDKLQQTNYSSLVPLAKEIVEKFVANGYEPVNFYSNGTVTIGWTSGQNASHTITGNIKITYLGTSYDYEDELVYLWNVCCISKDFENFYPSQFTLGTYIQDNQYQGYTTQTDRNNLQQTFNTASAIYQFFTNIKPNLNFFYESGYQTSSNIAFLNTGTSVTNDWNRGVNASDIIPDEGVYMIYFIREDQTYYLQGLSVKKQYRLQYINSTNYYTIEVI